VRRALLWILVLPLLIGGLILTVLRVAQLDAGLAVRLVSFAPLALAAYVVAALLLVVPAVRGRGAPQIALVVALAGVAAHGWWLAPYWTGATPPPNAQAEPMTVMSVNMLAGSADATQVVEVASERGVDLLAVQEITGPALAQMEAAGLEALLPSRLGRPGSGVEGTMLFAAGELADAGTLDTGFDSVTAELDTGATDGPGSPDDPLRVLAVHPRPPIQDAAAWASDHRVVREAATGDGEVVDLVVGDFNATLDHEPMMRLVDAGLRDAGEVGNAGWRPTWPMAGTLGWSVPLVAIDHVMLGPRIAVLDTDVVEIDGTDHAAVLAEVAVK
jgi:endonuclease/exonuclease/phosphatase family metal-dependent hydrolase